MPRVLFLSLFNYPNKTTYPNTLIESAARSCSDNRGCTVYRSQPHGGGLITAPLHKQLMTEQAKVHYYGYSTTIMWFI